MQRAIYNRVTYGTSILARFTELGTPPPVKDDLAAFKAQHTAFLLTNATVDKAERAFDIVEGKVAELDIVRDKTIGTLANDMPSLGLGTRAKPFGTFSKYAPSKLAALPYLAEGIAVRSLVDSLREAKPPAKILAHCTALTKQNDAVDAALGSLTKPLAVLSDARMKRDAILPDWEKALRNLKDSTKVAVRDIKGRFELLFAEPESVQLNARTKPRKAPPVSGVVGEGGTPAEPAKKKSRRGK